MLTDLDDFIVLPLLLSMVDLVPPNVLRIFQNQN